MTWSNSYPDVYGPPQHVSSINYQTYNKLMKKTVLRLIAKFQTSLLLKARSMNILIIGGERAF